MDNLATSTGALNLVPAQIDPSTEKTQFALAGCSTAVSAIAACLPITSVIHLLNAAFLILSSLLVAGIAAQLSSRFGKRLSPAAAAWAGMLFALFPQHSQLASTPTVSLDLLAVALALFAAYTYLRFRLLNESGYLNLSLLSFVLVTFVSVQALCLPFIVLAGELLLFASERPAPAAATASGAASAALPARFMPAIAYWMLFIMIGTGALAFPTALLPLRSLHASLAGWLPAVRDAQTWWQLSAPAAAYYPTVNDAAFFAYALAGAPLIVRLAAGRASWRAVAWLVSWLAFALLPTGPGSELSAGALLIASAALCLLLACGCVPCIDATNRRTASIATTFGCIIAAAITAVFTAGLVLPR